VTGFRAALAACLFVGVAPVAALADQLDVLKSYVSLHQEGVVKVRSRGTGQLLCRLYVLNDESQFAITWAGNDKLQVAINAEDGQFNLGEEEQPTTIKVQIGTEWLGHDPVTHESKPELSAVGWENVVGVGLTGQIDDKLQAAKDIRVVFVDGITKDMVFPIHGSKILMNAVSKCRDEIAKDRPAEAFNGEQNKK
jgi:hypothetical protein